MPPEKIDSLADDVKPLVLGLLRQISGLTARVDELLAQNKALLARITELEVLHGKPPTTPDNSSLPPSRGQKGNVAEPTRVKKDRKGRPGAARALAENPDATRDIYAEGSRRRLRRQPCCVVHSVVWILAISAATTSRATSKISRSESRP
jgi:hypothetical protein